MKGCGPVRVEENKWLFTVWAPELTAMSLHIVSPSQKTYPMQKDEEGYFSIVCEDIAAGTQYFYQPDDDEDVPDPASHFQPNGIHGYSEVVDHSTFQWHDGTWRGKPLKDLIIYELHVGTFTDVGTFEGVISRLDDLIDLGVNAIEIMPVAQFPGKRNWGYDGVYPYAVQNSYGGPDGLKLLVDTCHQKGIVVILDVVYNHMGPEGNYFKKFGPYFTGAYHVPWGDAINFDQQWADGVREYFLNNIDHWILNYHIDGLRLDAIHTIFDSSANNILAMFNNRAGELQEQTGRNIFLIAESDLNDPRIIREFGFGAQWLDDFHHSLYVFIHPEGKKQYEDFGSIYQLAKAFKDGFVSTGEYVKFRKRKYGASSAGIDGHRFVVFIQNHDQVGNRVLGERLSSLVGMKQLMISAAAMFLSPYVPMLFMGEEYAEDAPFMYFVDHSDKQLIAAVREGRKKEFAHMGEGEPWDAQDEKTFLESKLRWNSRLEGDHRKVLDWYKQLIKLRKDLPRFEKHKIQVSVLPPKCISIYHEEGVHVVFNFSSEEVTFMFEEGNWNEVLSSEKSTFGKIKPLSVSVYRAS